MSVDWFDRHFYAGVGSRWDDLILRNHILRQLGESDTVLDLGAGAGVVQEMDFRQHVRRVCGVDPDTRVLANPLLHEAKIGLGEDIPYEDATFDLAFSDNVLEHLGRPEHVFQEIARVLKPGGRYLVKTPNRWHYMPFAARWTPYTFHKWWLARRGTDPTSLFPTRYRANTRGALHALAHQAGLNVVYVDHIESRPEYLRFSPVPYLFGLAYERFVNSSPRFEMLRILLVACFQKQSLKGSK